MLKCAARKRRFPRGLLSRVKVRASADKALWSVDSLSEHVAQNHRRLEQASPWSSHQTQLEHQSEAPSAYIEPLAVASNQPACHDRRTMSKIGETKFSSLAELALAAGVSAATVSRALAGNPMISVATRHRIAELARLHDFRPNQQARNLRLRRTQAIGVLLPLGHETGQHLSDPFFMAMLGHLGDELTERGYDLLLSRIIPDSDDWLDRMIDSGRTDGTVIIGQSNQAAALDRAAARGAPIVVWGTKLPGQTHCSVGSDNFAGGRLASEHLIAIGRRRLVFFGNPEAPEIAERERGVRFACAAVGASCDTLAVHLTADEAYGQIVHYFGRHAVPDGIVAASDTIAMVALRVLAERGVRVPEDVGVVGYDDLDLAAHTTPPLTSVRQDIAQGAALLVELLMRRLNGEAIVSVVLPPELVVRRSTAAAREL